MRTPAPVCRLGGRGDGQQLLSGATPVGLAASHRLLPQPWAPQLRSSPLVQPSPCLQPLAPTCFGICTAAQKGVVAGAHRHRGWAGSDEVTGDRSSLARALGHPQGAPSPPARCVRPTRGHGHGCQPGGRAGSRETEQTRCKQAKGPRAGRPLLRGRRPPDLSARDAQRLSARHGGTFQPLARNQAGASHGGAALRSDSARAEAGSHHRPPPSSPRGRNAHRNHPAGDRS